MYISIKGAANENGLPSSFSSSSNKRSYFKSELIFMKNVTFTMSADDVAKTTVETVSVGLLI